ncbi:flavin reductase (DIM6/NTAB) family NADH-FMN oxidoreductase RutF [Prauserella isguenensis]|uniref:Flavin reductase (DIM6/NTAB) family NADH-FMN oxidoreductase RutF n=1 Tax=Prauserella isguenensis TaxID=1470180 RepID=A0A839S875_9PSEU|nr:flavin reductase family protein [Prauserella isguenensis]MBB3053190.1 flavin reductase (DIM6/NTAB) family NADH-FMN oxidoreductase RutF [Prauserella isguenensis]
MAIDPKKLRGCLGHFTTGVTVITCRAEDGEPHGATVNAFTAVSLDPPLVLVSVDRRSRLCGLIDSRPFTVNVLEASQKELALHFAGKPTQEVRWAPDSACGTPQLDGTLAHIACNPWRTYDGGDHVLFLGEVQEFLIHEGRPLLFHTGKFHHLGGDHEPLFWDESADGPGGVAFLSGSTAGST